MIYTYQWSDASAAQPAARPDSDQTYLLTVTDSSRSCRNVSVDSVRIRVLPPLPLPAFAGADVELCAGESLELGEAARASWTYRWSPSAWLSDSSAAQPLLVIPENTVSHLRHYQLEVRDSSGLCVASGSDTLSVRIVPCAPDKVFFPNVITPNGDGINERFVIEGLPSGSRLEVFDRWGRRVFFSRDYQHDWSGSQLREGVYYYHCRMPSGYSKKGNVTLMR